MTLQELSIIFFFGFLVFGGIIRYIFVYMKTSEIQVK